MIFHLRLILVVQTVLGCLDNDTALQALTGKSMATCAVVHSMGQCSSNCGALLQHCCETCSQECSGRLRPLLGRYCELLLMTETDPSSEYVADVIKADRCVESSWAPLTMSAPHVLAVVQEQRPEVVSVRINGPRYTLMSMAAPCCGQTMIAKDPAIYTYGGIAFKKIAVTRIPKQNSHQQEKYSSVNVERSTRFLWCGGCEVYQLIDNNGEIYIMQSFSQIVDRTLSLPDLRDLGPRLSLPCGWSYRATNLSEDFVYEAVVATVLCDDFLNCYTKMHHPDCVVCAPAPAPSSSTAPPLEGNRCDTSASDTDASASVLMGRVVGYIVVLLSMTVW